MAEYQHTSSTSKAEHLPEADISDMTAGQSSNAGARPVSAPPGYDGEFEMQPIPRLVNRNPAPLPISAPAVQVRDEVPFNFNFYKPRKDIRKHLVGLIFFLVLALILLSTIFGMKFADLQQQMRDQPKPQNTTVTLYSTASTSIFSTSSTTASTTISTTASTTLSTTLVQSTTLVESTTLQASTVTSVSVQSTTLTQLSTFQTTLPTTTTQISTVTTTSTSIIATIQPTAISACWVLLGNICSNLTPVLADLQSDGFGNCATVYRFFYCGLINHLAAAGDLTVPQNGSAVCGAMKEFCEGDKGFELPGTEGASTSGSSLPTVSPNMISMSMAVQTTGTGL